MTVQEAREKMEVHKTADEWIKFEKEFYDTLTKEEQDEVGAGALIMVEICNAIRQNNNG